MNTEIIKAIKKLCVDEQDLWETDAPVTDGTEDICEGRAEFAIQILRLIRKLEATTPASDNHYTQGLGPLDGAKKMTMKEMPSAVQLQWSGTHAYKNDGGADFDADMVKEEAKFGPGKQYSFDSPEWKAVVQANNARNEESATKNSTWAPGAIDRMNPDA